MSGRVKEAPQRVSRTPRTVRLVSRRRIIEKAWKPNRTRGTDRHLTVRSMHRLAWSR